MHPEAPEHLDRAGHRRRRRTDGRGGRGSPRTLSARPPPRPRAIASRSSPVDEPPDPSRMTRHHQSPLAPPPPKSPPPPLKPPPPLEPPPPNPPPNPPPPPPTIHGTRRPGPVAAPAPVARGPAATALGAGVQRHAVPAMTATARPATSARRIPGGPVSGPGARTGARVRPGDRLVDRVEAGRDPVGHPALTEARRHLVSEDRAADRVGQGALQAVAHLEAHPPVVQEHQEDHAVVEALLAEPPGLGQPNREVLQALALEGPEDRHHDLVGAAPARARPASARAARGRRPTARRRSR